MSKNLLYAKVNAEGEILAVGGAGLKLGSGTGEEARNSAAWEYGQGIRIRRVMVVDELMELAAEVVSEVMRSPEGRKHDLDKGSVAHPPTGAQGRSEAWPLTPGANRRRGSDPMAGPWREMDEDEHIKHARQHVRLAEKAVAGAHWMHLRHALTRVAMALFVSRDAQLGTGRQQTVTVDDLEEPLTDTL